MHCVKTLPGSVSSAHFANLPASATERTPLLRATSSNSAFAGTSRALGRIPGSSDDLTVARRSSCSSCCDEATVDATPEEAAARQIAKHDFGVRHRRVIDYVVSPEMAEGGSHETVRLGRLQITAIVFPGMMHGVTAWDRFKSVMSCGFAVVNLTQDARYAHLIEVRSNDGSTATPADLALGQSIVAQANHMLGDRGP